MQETIAPSRKEGASWLDRPLLTTALLNIETILFAAILIVAIFSRLYILGARVMSHDETSHVYFSWQFYQGNGFQHDPIMHGPLQFHLVALTYFLFGDNDFTARIPAALFSIGAVVFAWFYRRFLGRAGALVAALLLTISPYLLFYGRYVRNEAFVAFFGIVMLWAVLMYLETGLHRYIYLMTAMLVLHFDTKETAYIYTAQLLLFLGIYLVYRIASKPWEYGQRQKSFITWIFAGLFLLIGAGVARSLRPKAPANAAAQAVQAAGTGPNLYNILMYILAGLAIIAFLVAVYYLLTGFGLKRVRQERTFDLLMVTGTLILPLLTAFPLDAIGLKVPTNAAAVNALTLPVMVEMGIGLLIIFLIAAVIGLWWNSREWLINFTLFYSIFVVFYTTLFTNGAGIFTGLLGSLGYWLEQQAVNRGSQPWYYYMFVQVPVYEYLPALGSLLALGLALAGIKPAVERLGLTPAQAQTAVATDNEGSIDPIESLSEDEGILPVLVGSNKSIEELKPGVYEEPPVLPLLGFWVITSLLAYTIAGEKMPWLTVHITLPMILLAGWAIGYLIDSVDWSRFKASRGFLVLAVLVVFLISLVASLGSLLGQTPPFQGKSLDQLAATSTFLAGFLGVLISAWGLFVLLRRWQAGQTLRVVGLVVFAFLGLLTMRCAFQASFVQYDDATELLVYAHTGPGVKEALAQIEELSRRTTDGLAMPVAYDNDTTYPYWWYLRDYTDQRYYAANPTRDLRQVPAILVGEANYSKIEPIVGQAYYKFEYIRMWWPDQGYFNLDWNRVSYAILNPQMRAAVFKIWLNHDYSEFAALSNKDLSLPHWDPASRMRLYLRKDLVDQLWNYGTTPSQAPVAADPYEGKELKISADRVLGYPGTGDGQFTTPRNMALAPDGSIYVADTGNHRIQHFTADGKFINAWGSFGAIQGSTVPPAGTFNEPWGIAVGSDGSVFVADTFNSRIQKFTADGKFVKMWGEFAQSATDPTKMWGPRSIAIDKNGHLLITDTGNKRVLIFDENGNYISQFGSQGAGPGQFDEPVGIAIDSSGKVYIADTWNQRVQVLAPDASGAYTQVAAWDISGWYGESLDNKPYIAVDDKNHVYVTDPEGYRVLEFTTSGQFIRFWGDFGATPDKFGMPVGITTDPQGGIWVADSGNGRVMHFTLPNP